MNHNLSADQRFIISHFKEMYDSNNRVLTSMTQIHNQNFNTETINNLTNNLISSNNEIMRNITNLLNTNNNLNTNANNILNASSNNNLNTNNRYQPSVRHQNRQQNNNRQNSNRYNNNYINPNSTAASSQITNLIYSFLEPIEIFPTQSQIESATRVVRFGDIIRPLNSACPITLENFNENDQVLLIRQCSHIFSNTGLISWFRTNCRCPVCRFDIRNYISRNTHNISELFSIVDNSSNTLPSSINSVERRTQNNSSSVLVDLIFNNLLGTRNLTDTSGNNVTDLTDVTDVTDLTDVSGNLLHFFFTPL